MKSLEASEEKCVPFLLQGGGGGKDGGLRSYPQWEAASQPSRKPWGTFSRKMGRNPRDTHFPGAGLEIPDSVSYFKKGFFGFFTERNLLVKGGCCFGP